MTDLQCRTGPLPEAFRNNRMTPNLHQFSVFCVSFGQNEVFGRMFTIPSHGSFMTFVCFFIHNMERLGLKFHHHLSGQLHPHPGDPSEFLTQLPLEPWLGWNSCQPRINKPWFIDCGGTLQIVTI